MHGNMRFIVAFSGAMALGACGNQSTSETESILAKDGNVTRQIQAFELLGASEAKHGHLNRLCYFEKVQQANGKEELNALNSNALSTDDINKSWTLKRERENWPGTTFFKGAAAGALATCVAAGQGGVPVGTALFLAVPCGVSAIITAGTVVSYAYNHHKQSSQNHAMQNLNSQSRVGTLEYARIVEVLRDAQGSDLVKCPVAETEEDRRAILAAFPTQEP